MSNQEFSYCLPSVPGPVAEDYLQSVFGRSAVNVTDEDLTLLFHYSDREPPESYLRASEQLPKNCILIRNHIKKFCLILIANHLDLGELLTVSSGLSCQKLYTKITETLRYKPSPEFRVRNRVWKTDQPRVMAILNITPDSFYDGGKYIASNEYAEIAQQMIEEGADIIDIGGESSRPGAKSVSAEEEINRILPAIKQIRQRFNIPLSVDTVKPEVAEEALKAGADMINDISGLSGGKQMTDVIKRHNASYCLIHIRGTPDRMQQNPEYRDVVAEVYGFLKDKINICREAGIPREKLCIDPGIGFGKKFSHNLHLLRFLSAFLNLDQLLLLGTSNKSFIGQALNRDIGDRLPGSLATQVLGWSNGATVFRVHEVKATRDAVQMAKLYSG